MKPELIRQFLAQPAALLPSVPDHEREAWLSSLADILDPLISRASELGFAGAASLREAQRKAIEGFADKRCALLLGPPGTGKTATLAWMVVAYVLSRRRRGQDCRVFVTAFTREAVSNLLAAIAARVRIAAEDIPVVFAGPQPDDEPEAVDLVTLKSLQTVLDGPSCVVGMTTWSSSKMLNNGWHGGPPGEDGEVFDLLCVDEASQMKVAQGLMALAPLCDSGRIVVAGDDRQLAPIGNIEQWEVEDHKLGGSLYDFLRSAGISEFGLSETFRLNRVLAAEPARLFYEEKYESAVPERRLQLRPGWRTGLSGWLAAAIDPESPVCILLHDGPPAATRNAFEIELVSETVSALAERIRNAAGATYGERLWTEGLAVVTPHRAQNAAIRSRLSEAHDGAVVDTVERIQGRERDAIVFSYSVADPEFARVEAAFLFAPERFNVAVTRPRSKLILIVSRRILGILPADEETFDSVRVLREYVYGSRSAGHFQHEGIGYPVQVEIRLRRFDDTIPLPAIESVAVSTEPPAIPSPELDEVEQAIRRLAAESTEYQSARSFDIDRALVRRVPFSSYRDLFRLGRVILNEEQRENNPPYWRLYPMDDGQVPLSRSAVSVGENLSAVYEELRTDFDGVLYKGARQRRGFRDRFAWCDPDGTDMLWPMLEHLQEQGILELSQTTNGRPTVRVPDSSQVPASAPTLPTDALSDDDFRLLNFLEDIEIRRANLGVFESWLEPHELLKAAQAAAIPGTATQSLRAIADSLYRLSEHGFVLSADARVRSRMAELGRELRQVKQRFVPEDQDRRPYLIRSLKMEARARYKPLPSIPLAGVVEQICSKWEDHPGAKRILRALVPAMRRGFRLEDGTTPLVSGFQQTALQGIAGEWLAKAGSRGRGFVITADTGAGKTEAACMPLLFGAALDRSSGIEGVRAVLVYPRIRLAVNQAARLVRYAKLFSDELGDVIVTVGLQYGDVPRSWSVQRRKYDSAADKAAELWRPQESGGWRFPFFVCPDCDGELTLLPGDPVVQADTLKCQACNWAYSGWAGSKEALAAHPPALFLTVTESLHQWMQDPNYGSLFGDRRPFAAPRAVLADEIHLYSHTHGAQVGWALRRLVGRCRLNGENSPIAIGMSATLGEPRAAWGRLAGLALNDVEQVQPDQSDRIENPRGREYFYFVQPEVESRGKDIAGASTTIQALMLLAHGMRRRFSPNGGFRSVAFLDSIDKLKRLHGDFLDAEVQKRLAKLRTRAFGRDAQNPDRLLERCCGEPRSCSRFRDGECWWFAANDLCQCGASGRPLLPGDPMAVAPRPIYSATRGNVDKLIEKADVLFATSSLEVGYDDPEMALVYQHYAPSNLASFIQRKGRGGRGVNDRPVTGATLSLYSARDSYFFRDPDRLLNPEDFRAPVNMDNIFVRRGQVLAAILDVASRATAQTNWRTDPALNTAILETADRFVRDIFGPDVFSELDVEGIAELWSKARETAEPALMANQSMRDWRTALRDVPEVLYEALNASSIYVHVPGRRDAEVEDVTLAFAECTPGRITRRWGLGEAHWIPILGSRGAFTSAHPRETGSFSLAPNASEQELRRLIPSDVANAMGGSIPGKVQRPLALRPQLAGEFQGTDWKPKWGWKEDERRSVLLEQFPKAIPIHHKTQGRLLGFATVSAERPPTARVDVPRLSAIGDAHLDVFLAKAGERSAGLRAAQVFWGCDVEIILDTLRRDRVQHREIFTTGPQGENALVGYGMQPEGVRVRLQSGRIDAFLEDEEAALLHDEARARWHRGQFLRYLLMTGASAVGLTTYEARQLADLCIAAAADPDIRAELSRAAQRGNGNRFREALERARDARLAFHPLLTVHRTARVLDRIDEPGVMQAIHTAFEEVKRADAFRSYLRSVLLHGMLVRLRQLFVIHGLGEERQALAHTRLPLQYSDSVDDVLTVCERSSGGDGTTRAFVQAAPMALSNWIDDRFVACPNAEADRVVEKAFSMMGEHARWRRQDPRDPAQISQLAEELSLDPMSGSGALQPLLRLLFQSDEVGGQRFSLYDLFQEIRSVRTDLAAAFGRSPTDWELVSGAVRRSVQGSPTTPGLERLLAAYRAQEEAATDETLAPEGRLAELIYRIGTRLCEDGCQACLHTGSDLMPDDLTEASTSRVLLERFGHFVTK